jgi:hypothetical protein
MQLFTELPNVDLRKVATKRREPAAPAASRPPAAPAPASAAPARVASYRLQVLRSLSGGPESNAPIGEDAISGSPATSGREGERFCHPSEALRRWTDERLWLEDLEGGNGVFLRIRTPIELALGAEFAVGDQLLRIEKNPVADDGPDPDPTYFYSSPKWPSSFRVLQILEGGAVGACVVARGNTLQVGSAIGDLVFPDDPLVSEQHCLVEEQAGSVLLTDLGSRTGVFVRVRGEQELSRGDELLIGRTRLVVEF